MALGRGKYDSDVTALRERYHADGVVLIVMGDPPRPSQELQPGALIP